MQKDYEPEYVASDGENGITRRLREEREADLLRRVKALEQKMEMLAEIHAEFVRQFAPRK